MKIFLISLVFTIFSFSKVNSQNSTKSSEKLLIFICTPKDFIPQVNNTLYYKIVAEDRKYVNEKYDLGIFYSNDNNELYPKKIGYSEGSKIYSIWKNYTPLPKYVGINLYNKYFKFMNDVPDMDELFKTYDAVLTKEESEVKSTYITYNAQYLPALDEILSIIKEKFPEYYETASKRIQMNKIRNKNIFIMKKEDFLNYAQFVFGVLNEFDKKNNLKDDYDIRKFISDNWLKNNPTISSWDIEYQRKIQKFLLECLSDIFYFYSFKNPLEMDITEFKEEKTITTEEQRKRFETYETGRKNEEDRRERIEREKEQREKEQKEREERWERERQEREKKQKEEQERREKLKAEQQKKYKRQKFWYSFIFYGCIVLLIILIICLNRKSRRKVKQEEFDRMIKKMVEKEQQRKIERAYKDAKLNTTENASELGAKNTIELAMTETNREQKVEVKEKENEGDII